MLSIGAYRELLASIKSIGVDNVAPKDKEVLLDLLKAIKYIAEFRLLKQCYDQDASLNNLLPYINNKIADLKGKIDAISEKGVTEGELSKFDEIKLKALTVTYNRYSEIKNAIKTRNFDHYVNFMNSSLNNANQIIAVCSGALDQANVDYAKEFSINGSTKTAVDLIYELKDQPDLVSQLTLYFNRKRHYTVDNEEQVRTDQQFLNYLEIIKNNEALVRKFMDAVFVIGTNGNDKETVVRERISRNKLRLADISDNFLSTIKHGKEIASLESSLEKDDAELKKIMEVKESYETILESMASIGLGDFAEAFTHPQVTEKETVQQRVVAYVKVSMRRNRFDIHAVKTKIEEEIRVLESQIVRKDELLAGSLNKLNSFGRELILKYPNEAEAILDVVNGVGSAEVTPILAAYVLKALMESKSLSVKSINEITHAYDQKGIKALVSEYEVVIKRTAESIEKAIGDVTNRAIYDSSSYGELKIR